MSRLAFAAAAVFLLAAPEADAGNLGKATKSISNKQGSSRSGSSGGSSSSRPRGSSTRDVHVADDGYDSGRGAYYATYRAPCNGCAPVAITEKRDRLPPRVDFRATYENVRDSDGSLNLDARLSAGPFGFGFGVSSYFEAARGAPDAVRMTMWEGNVAGRALLAHDRTEVWLTLGVAGLHSNQFENVLGGAVGASLRHELAGGLSIDARARGLAFEDDISATEVRAGITASVLHVGYRHLRFNVGPALQGPEVGLSLRF